MTAHTHWTVLRRERAQPAFAPTPPRKGTAATASSAKVSAWENEGGSLAEPPGTVGTRSIKDTG